MDPNVRYDNTTSKFNFQCPGLKVKVTVAILRKQKTTNLCHRSSPYIYQLISIYLHAIVGYYNISSNFNFQVAGLKVRVTVAFFFCHCSSLCICQRILICLQNSFGYYNISSEFNFQVAGLKVKVTVVIFRKEKAHNKTTTFSSL